MEEEEVPIKNISGKKSGAFDLFKKKVKKTATKATKKKRKKRSKKQKSFRGRKDEQYDVRPVKNLFIFFERAHA
jgi:hypothetical protein